MYDPTDLLVEALRPSQAPSSITASGVFNFFDVLLMIDRHYLYFTVEGRSQCDADKVY